MTTTPDPAALIESARKAALEVNAGHLVLNPDDPKLTYRELLLHLADALDAAQADARRLDWLQANFGSHRVAWAHGERGIPTFTKPARGADECFSHPTLRDAVDAAMQAGRAKP